MVLSTYEILIGTCGLVIVSYLFSIISKYTRIPSVLMLLGLGMLLKYWAGLNGIQVEVPTVLIEFLGTIGLIMIVLEAGLDLEITRDRLPLIRNSFFSALIIFIISTLAVAALLYWWKPGTSMLFCIVYAIPLSIVSSAVVLPSVHHLSHQKKEFLIYEASFSDVIGIMCFNLFSTNEHVGTNEIIWFTTSIVLAVLLSVAVCFGLMWILINNQISIKFFLSFAVLIAIYVGGKMLHLPSLITILTFGLVINNWALIKVEFLKRFFTDNNVAQEVHFLKSITAESSFLIRTFFFVIFGFGIDMGCFQNKEVVLMGSSIVILLLILRYIYLRFLHKYTLMPELFYIPRGLITILLFYKIPEWQRIESFDEGVLFFVILATGLILMFGAIFFKDRPVEMVNMDETINL